MKKTLMIAGFFLPLLMFGSCQTQEHKQESKFEQDLRGLYAKVQSIAGQTQTRAGGKFAPLDEQGIEEVIIAVREISEQNNIADQISRSGYYSELVNGNISIDENSDVYDILVWAEENGTPEFYNLMLSIEDNNLTLEEIINNDNLLPNEQLELIVGLGLVNSTPMGVSPNQCSSQYNTSIAGCESACVKRSLLAVGVAVFSPASGVVMLVSAALEYHICVNDAIDRYNACMKN